VRLSTFAVLLSACAADPGVDDTCDEGQCDTKLLWRDATAATIGVTGEWSNKVELADIDGDGRVDIVFANGGDYNMPASEVSPNRIFLNRGRKRWQESTEVLGAADLARVVKVRDVSGDGIADILVGTTYQTQSRLYLGTGGGQFDEVTATHLPQRVGSIGDIELGDIDGDGDLDAVLADWGPGDPFESEGAPVRVWLNAGDGHFSDSANAPTAKIQWSWDLELLDVDNDYDLDILVACKVCPGGKLFLGDGRGSFTDASARLPQFTNNYDFEPFDLDGDGLLDLITVNDGDAVDGSDVNRREHVFRNTGDGFEDVTAAVWPEADNVGSDDNVAAVLDIDSDGDADFVLGSLDGDDRVLINDKGKLKLRGNAFGGDATPGTLGLAFADLDGDNKIDAVQSQGELADDERLYFGSGIAADTAPPSIDLVEQVAPSATATVRVRVHDRKTPVMPHDFQRVELRAAGKVTPLVWYGGALWRATTAIAPGTKYQVCAVDAAGNEACK
jgi:hypothetical protein